MGREARARGQLERKDVALGVVTEAFVDRPLVDLLEWLVEAAPEITALEIGTGGYAPHPHCDRELLLSDPQARSRWTHELQTRGFTVAALNVWGNPLHPDPEIGARHDRDLRDTIRLAAELGVDRIVALAGCPAATRGERTPHFAAGGWLPYLENVYDAQWDSVVAPYWSGVGDFARAVHPDLMICIELHPGTAVYNVSTFSLLAALGGNLRANIDPSHFFWQKMDTNAVIDALRGSVAHVHAKDLVFNEQVLGVTGVLDHRWPGRSSEVAWSFATIGKGHDAGWWTELVGWLPGTAVRAIAIEHEDPDVPAEIGVPEAARLLAGALS